MSQCQRPRNYPGAPRSEDSARRTTRRSSCLFGLNLDLLGLDSFRLWNAQGQEAIVKIGLNGIYIDRYSKAQTASKSAVIKLMLDKLGAFGRSGQLATDGQLFSFKGNLYIFRVDTR